MRSAAITLGSVVLTLCVITNAHYQKRQFYPSVVYITKSNVSMAVIYLQAFVMVVLMGKLVRKVFFGQLRAAEMEHLIEKSWYAVTETCLAFTVFRDDFSPKFVALFTLLLFLKCFHWLAEDRVDYMERSPIISFVFHMRVVTLLFMLGLSDFLLVRHAYHSTLTKGPTVQLVFGFEYAILFTICTNVFIKYILHTIDLQSENPWDNKAVFLLYTELVMGFVKVVLYLTFMTIMIKIHTFPLFAIRPMYLSMRAFKKALHDVIMSRRAIRNMNTLYPNATAEELAAVDNVCIICREEMTGGSGSKKLPCNHIFHASCLRSWFQRQQTCPTCRMDVLRIPQNVGAAANATPAQPVQQQPQAQVPPGQPPYQNLFMPGAGLPPMPFWFPPMPQPGGEAANAGPSSTATPTPGGQQAQFMMPPFPFLPPLIPQPPPPPSADLTQLTPEELQAMEGNEREHVEARIRHLQNIRTLLDAAVLHMQQYTLIVSNLGPTVPKPQTENTETVTGASAPTVPVVDEDIIPEEEVTLLTSDSNLDNAAGHSSTETRDELRRRRLERFESSRPGVPDDDEN